MEIEVKSEREKNIKIVLEHP